MTQKNKEKTAARELQVVYGCSYAHALNLIRNHGTEKAKQLLEDEKKP